MDGGAYKKNKGNAGLDGVQFQLDLLIVFLLNALRNHKNWKISSENQEAGKYDDLVLELTDRNIFLQSKFKQTRKITKDQLFSCNPKTADFSLPKYFFSYLEIKSEFKEKTVIICTNGEVNPKGLENVLVHHNAEGDSLLHCEGATCPFFTLNENVVPDLRANAEIYFDKNLQGRNMDKAVITDKNLKEFLKNLQFFYNYPSGGKLHKIIEQLLLRLGDWWCKTSHHEIYRKVEDWFKQPKGEYLTEFRSNAMLCEIRSDRFCESLKNYNVSFSNVSGIAELKGVIHFKMKEGHLMQILKSYCILQSVENRKLFVNPDDTIEMQKQAVEAFSLRRYNFLIMAWAAISDETAKREIIRKVKEILERDRYKKVILIAGDEYVLVPQFGLEVCQIDESITFQDLSKDTQDRLLKTKNVIFQGNRVRLEELLHTEAAEDYTKSLDSVMLEQLVRGEKIKVGIRLLDLDEDTARYYRPRFFDEYTTELRIIKYILTENTIFGVKKKVIMISESAGMGKSTVLTKIAVIIKKNNPSLWVIKINLNDYTRVLRDFVKTNREQMNAEDLLNSQEATKMTDKFENFVFSISGKVVLMLDGVDEISPDYTNLVLSLLNHCQDAPNFAKIFVTTRPHVDLKLNNVALLKMLPLTKLEQRNFLTDYWMHNLHLGHENKAKCKQYATILIEKISSWTILQYYRQNPFTDMPLQVRMLAEIFQENVNWEEYADWEGCREFLERNGDEPKLPEKFNIAKLYDAFIEKKRDIFTDKGCSSGSVIATPALLAQFESYLAYHRSISVRTLLPDYQQLFKTQIPVDSNTEEYILKIGIVQRFGGLIHFIHRTFAEYFLASCIVQELKLQNPDPNFQRLLIDTILCTHEFENVRVFLDILLQKVPLPSNVFKQYRSLKYEPKPNLIFDLAREGHVAIFRLILENVHFKVTEGRHIVKDWQLRIPFRKRNTLNDLAVHLRKSGLNVKCGNGGVLLHYAVRGGHLEMLDFLLDLGADINVEDNESRTALYLATHQTDWNIIKRLTEHGADVNVKDDWGFTALHRVIILGTLDIVCNLLIRRANINIENSENGTELQSATSRKNLTIVKYLAEHGADVNATDNFGFTILQHAIVLGVLDVVACLVDHGADVNIGDNQGLTALHIAVKLNKTEIVEYLLKRNADVNMKDDENRSALHLAVSWNHLNVVERLLKHGADVNIMDISGRTALHYAVEGNMWNIVNHFVQHDSSLF